MILSYSLESRKKEQKEAITNFTKKVSAKLDANGLLLGGYCKTSTFLDETVLLISLPKPFPPILKYIAITSAVALFVFWGVSWWLLAPFALVLLEVSGDYVAKGFFKWSLKKKGYRGNIRPLDPEQTINYLVVNYVAN